MLTENAVLIRKLRKKLRQIENLERRAQLSPEEQLKVARKGEIRSRLQELLPSQNTEGSTVFSTAIPSPDPDSTFDSLCTSGSDPCTSYLEDEDDFEDDDDDDEDDELDEEEEEEEDEGVENKDSMTCMRTERPSSTSAGDVHDTEGITDEEKVKRQMNTGAQRTSIPKPQVLAADDEKVTTYEPSPPKKAKTEDTKQKSQAKSQTNPLKQLQKKWSRSRWKVDRLIGHSDLVCSVSLCGRYLLSGSRDTTVKLWDAISRREVCNLGGHTGCVTAVVLLGQAESKLIVQALNLDQGVTVSEPGLGISGSSDCSIKLWDTSSGMMLKSMYAFSPVNCLAITVWNGKPCLFSGSSGGKVELWDLEAGCARISLRAHQEEVTALSADQDTVYSTAADGEIRVHKIKDDTLATVFVSENVKLTSGMPVLRRHIRSVVGRGNMVYYGDDAMNIKALDWMEGVVHKLGNHTTEFGSTDALSISPGHDLMMSSGYDLDNGLGFINLRQLSSEKYFCSLCDEKTGRIMDIDCCSTVNEKGSIVMVTAGMELVLWQQIQTSSDPHLSEKQDLKNTIGAQFVSHFTRAPHHSDEDSGSEAELTLEADDIDDENGAGLDENLADRQDDARRTVSPPFDTRRDSRDAGGNSGWLSWCTIL